MSLAICGKTTAEFDMVDPFNNLSSRKTDRGVGSPKHGVRPKNEKSSNFNYLRRQKESIDKVDQLIEEAEQSLKQLRKEFYQNTLQEMSKAGFPTSTATSPKVAMSRSMQKMLTAICRGADVAGSTALQSSLTEPRLINDTKCPIKRAIGQPKSRNDAKKMPGDIAQTPNVRKKAHSAGKKTASEKKPHKTKRPSSVVREASEKSIDSLKNSPGETTSSGSSVRDTQAESACSREDMEVEVNSINLREDDLLYSSCSTENMASDRNKRSVRVADEVESHDIYKYSVDMDSIDGVASVPVDFNRFMKAKNSLYLRDIPEDDIPETITPVPVDETRFMNTKNSIFLRMPSVTNSMASESENQGRTSVRISTAPAKEISVSILPSDNDVNNEESKVSVGTPSLNETNDETNAVGPSEDIKEEEKFVEEADAQEETSSQSSQLSETVKDVSPQISETLIKNGSTGAASYRCAKQCVKKLATEGVLTSSGKLYSTEDDECPCKTETEMLEGVQCYKLMPRLKSSSSEKKPPKRTSFCFECQTLTHEDAGSGKTSGSVIHDIFVEDPLQSTDIETDESYLNTISERTEPPSTARSGDNVASKPKQLTVQHLPQINIKPPLVIQKVFEIEIKPTGSVQMEIPPIQNIRYEEVSHSEGAEEMNPVLMEDIGKAGVAYKYIRLGTSINVMQPNISLGDMTPEVTPVSSVNEILANPNIDDAESRLLEFNGIHSASDTKVKEMMSDTEPEATEETGEESDPFPTNSKESLELKPVTIQKSGTRKGDVSKVSLKLKPSLKSIQPEGGLVSQSSSVIFKLAPDILAQPEKEPYLSLNPGPCGCREGSTHDTDEIGLILDETFDQRCDCQEEPEDPAKLELKKSLHEASVIEHELNQSLSVRLFEEEVESKKLNFRLLDVTNDVEDGENLNDPGEVIKDGVITDSPTVQRCSSKAASTTSESEPSTPPLRNISGMRNLKEAIMTDAFGKADPSKKEFEEGRCIADCDASFAGAGENEDDDEGRGEQEDSVVGTRSERGTPLFTKDANLPAATKVPKSISQFFNESEASILDDTIEEEEVTIGKLNPEPLSQFSAVKKAIPYHNNPPTATDQLVQRILNELDKDLDELGGGQTSSIIAVNCECICKEAAESPIPGIFLKQAESSSPRKSVGSKTSVLQKLKGKKKRKSDTSNSMKGLDSEPPKAPIKSTSKLAQSTKKSKTSTSKLPLPIVAPATTSTIMSDRQRASIRRGSIVRSQMFVDPKVKESLMGAFDLSEANSTYGDCIRTPVMQPRTPTQTSQQPSSEAVNDAGTTSQSDESVYVLTHDVNTQVSSHSELGSERRQSLGSRTDKKTPRVTISISSDDPRLSSAINNYSKKNKKVTSKDQIQQISADRNGAITNPSGEEAKAEQIKAVVSTASICSCCVDETKQPVLLHPVTVEYESIGVQKSLEDWGYPQVKLHKMTTCNDIESASTNETDYETFSSRNAACGDIPALSEFLPMNATKVPNRIYMVDATTSASGNPNLKIYTSSKYNYNSSSTDTTDSRLEERMSEGEIKCRCSVSVGELHSCHKNGSKARTTYLKKHPEALLKQEFPTDNVQLLRQRKLYDNWVTYYTSKTPSTNNGSDTTIEVSTDT